MALSAYEIRVIVSAQDHFSGAFRQIGRDLGKMSRMQAQAAKDTARLNKEINKSQLAQKGLLRQVDSMRRGGKLHNALMDKQARTTEKLARQEERLAKATAARDRITRKSLPAARVGLQAAQKAVRDADRALDAAGEPTRAQERSFQRLREQRKGLKRSLKSAERESRTARGAARMSAADALASAKTKRDLLQEDKEATPEQRKAAERQVRKAARVVSSKRQTGIGALGQVEDLKRKIHNLDREIAHRYHEVYGEKDTAKLQENADLARARRTQAHANIRDLEKQRTANNMDLKALREKITATKALQAAQKAQATSMFQNSKQLKAAAREMGLTEKQLTQELVKQQAHMQRLNTLQQRQARIRAAGHTGRLMTMAGGIGLAVGAGLANYAADFQKQVTLAATQTPGTVAGGVPAAVKNAKVLGSAILDLSRDYGIATEEITKSSYDIFSSIRFSGTAAQQFKQGMDTIKLSAMAAVGGLTNMETASKAVIIMANQFGDSFGQMSRNLDTAFAIVRYGNMTFEQFTSMMTKVGSAASRAGFSLQEVSGIMVMLTKKSGKPDEAATWIDRMLQALQTPEFVKGMRMLHAPIDKDGKLKPLSAVMDQILKIGVANKGRGGIGMQNIIPYITSVGKHGFEGGAGLRSTIQAQRGLTFSLQDVKSLKQAYRDVSKDQGEFMRSFETVYNSAGYKWQRLLAGFKVAAIELGNALLPIMTKIVAYILSFVQYISNASPAVKTFAATIFAVVSAFTLLSGVFVSVAAGFASIYYWVKIIGVGAEGGSVGVAGFAAMLLKVSVIGTAVIATLYGLKQAWDDFKGNDVQGNFLQKFLRGVHDVGGGIRKITGEKWIEDQFGAGGWWDAIFEHSFVIGTATKKKAGNRAKSSIDEMMDKINKAMKAAGLGQKDKFKKQAQDALNELLRQTTTPSQAEADRKQRANDIVAAQKQILDQAAQGLMNMYKEKKQQNENLFGQLFAGPVAQSGAVQWRKAFGIQMNVPELLSDFKLQLKQFDDARRQITTLRKRGLSDEIISDLQARGAEGMPYIKALMEATPKQIKEFNRLMGSKKKDITAATEIDFDAQLAKWMKFGAKAALQIASGMESEEFAVQKRLNAMAARLWSGIAKTMAAKQVTLQYGVLPAAKNAPPLVTSGAGATTQAHGISAAAYAANLNRMGYAAFNPNLVRLNPVGTPGEGFPKALPSGDYAAGKGPQGARQMSVHYHDHYEVNGTFMSEQQMMDRALKVTAFKKKQGRRG